jgi:hypothetical protein
MVLLPREGDLGVMNLRVRIVSVVATLFALATGILLGYGLSDDLSREPAAASGDDLDERLVALQEELDAAEGRIDYGQDFAGATAFLTLRGTLTGRPVLLVVAPTADPALASELARLVPLTGGTLAGRVDLGTDLLAASSRQLVQELGSQLASGFKKLVVPKGLTGYDRLGWLLARATTTKADAGVPVDPPATGISGGLKAGKFATPALAQKRRASIVLFVAPTDVGDSTGATSILGTLAEQFAGQSDAVVLVGSGTEQLALIDSIRADAALRGRVATVDSATTMIGRLTALLAAASAARGTVGHYGLAASAQSPFV